MKIAIILLAIIGLGKATEVAETFAARSLSSVAVQAIESKRDEMPCGFPEMGIPPLAPLKIRHKKVNFDTETFKLHGDIRNFRLNGLNDFDIEEMKITALSSKVNFRFVFRNVNFDTQYDLRLFLKKAGFTINLIGNGPAKFAIKSLDISGTVKYSYGIFNGKLKLKTLSIRTHIGEVESDIKGILGESHINKQINDVLAEVVELAINENEDAITENIEAFALPMVNEVLSDLKLSDLIGNGGGGGGGGSGGSGGQKEKCTPPSD